jgi:hypothetical protein
MKNVFTTWGNFSPVGQTHVVKTGLSFLNEAKSGKFLYHIFEQNFIKKLHPKICLVLKTNKNLTGTYIIYEWMWFDFNITEHYKLHS